MPELPPKDPVPQEPEPTPEEPPVIVDPPKPLPADGGLCVRPVDPDAPMVDEWQRMATDTRGYVRDLSTGIDAMRDFQCLLPQLRAADTLPEPQRSARLLEMHPRLEGFLEAFYKLGESAQAPQHGFEPCHFVMPEWMKDLRTRY